MSQKSNKPTATSRKPATTSHKLDEELRLDTKRLLEEVRREGLVGFPSKSISRELAEKIRNKYFPNKKAAIDDNVAAQSRNELMNEALRRAQEIRRSLEGRQHSDSTNLLDEDRKR